MKTKKIKVYTIWGDSGYSSKEIDESFQNKSAQMVANEIIPDGCPDILYEVRFPNNRSVVYKDGRFQWIYGTWQDVSTAEIERFIKRKIQNEKKQEEFDQQVYEAKNIMIDTWNDMIDKKFKNTNKDVLHTAVLYFLSCFK